MSQQALDLRRFVQIVRRYKVLVGFVLVLGLVAGGAYAGRNPASYTSTALVVLPQAGQNGAAEANGQVDPYTATQEVIAGGNQVLSGARPNIHPTVSLIALRRDIHVGSVTPYIISISAKSNTAGNAEATANAVANSYISYIGSSRSPVGRVAAELLQPAVTAAGSSRVKQIAIFALIGAMFGAAIGIVIALAIGRADRRLRERDEIAKSIGVSVIASFPVGHPVDAAGWRKLLENYKPEALHAVHLQKALQLVRTAAVNATNGRQSRSSFVVLSLASDPGALAIGPQLAVFAASQGVPTTLLIGPQQDADVTATLRTACAVPLAKSSTRPSQLRVTVSDGDVDVQPDSALTVVVVVVDGLAPRIPGTMRTVTTLLGVSAGAATAEELARVAVCAAADDREIAGILMADPESTDRTTGRIPQLPWRTQYRPPTRLKGLTTEIRR